jgi:hypothetical protein
MYFLCIEYGTLKLTKVILRLEKEKRKNDGQNEPKWGTL